MSLGDTAPESPSRASRHLIDLHAAAGEGTRRLAFLDALRGLAAAYVVVYHMLLLPQPDLVAPHWVAKFAHAGGTGVTLFFIVSAFSLYYTMPLRLRTDKPNLSFFLHRFFRIAPLFYFLILASMVRDYLVFDALHPPLDVALAATFVFNLVPGHEESIVWAGWTIGVEMLFYAIFPLLYGRIQSIGNAIAFFFGCLLAWLLLQLVLDYATIAEASKQSILKWSLVRHMPIFAVGIVLYHAYARLYGLGQRDGGTLRAAGNALAAAGVFGFAALLQGWLPAIFGDSYYWQGLVFGCLFLGLAFAPWRVLVNAASCYLGKISYSLYLNHTTVIFLMAPAYHWLYDRLPSLTLAFLASLALTFAVALPLSALTYRFIEVPGIALGKKVAARWVRRDHHRAAVDAPSSAKGM